MLDNVPYHISGHVIFYQTLWRFYMYEQSRSGLSNCLIEIVNYMLEWIFQNDLSKQNKIQNIGKTRSRDRERFLK
jgi:hypothetical protein